MIVVLICVALVLLITIGLYGVLFSEVGGPKAFVRAVAKNWAELWRANRVLTVLVAAIGISAIVGTLALLAGHR